MTNVSAKARERDARRSCGRRRGPNRGSRPPRGSSRRRWVEVFVVRPADRFMLLTMILGLLLALTLLKLVCVFAEELLVGSVVQLTVMRIRKACFRQVLASIIQP